jgi:hypothetical protein
MSCLTGPCSHEFVDQYDEIETIPDTVMHIAANCMESDEISQILEGGKLKTKSYVMSYCKCCGKRISRYS